MNNLNSEDFFDLISNSDVEIIDVRRPDEFIQGYINGAKNIDYEKKEFVNLIKKLNMNKTYAIYCRSGRRSARAIEMMEKLGFNSLFNLSGGIIEWESTGRSVVK